MVGLYAEPNQFRWNRRIHQYRWERLELQSELESNHPRRAIPAQADPEQSSWRRRCIGEGAEASLRGWFTRDSSEDHAWETEIRMIEDIEELCVESKFHPLRQEKPFR